MYGDKGDKVRKKAKTIFQRRQTFLCKKAKAIFVRRIQNEEKGNQ